MMQHISSQLSMYQSIELAVLLMVTTFTLSGYVNVIPVVICSVFFITSLTIIITFGFHSSSKSLLTSVIIEILC